MERFILLYSIRMAVCGCFVSFQFSGFFRIECSGSNFGQNENDIFNC